MTRNSVEGRILMHVLVKDAMLKQNFKYMEMLTR